jgi:fluoroquinolone resistance protein
LEKIGTSRDKEILDGDAWKKYSESGLWQDKFGGVIFSNINFSEDDLSVSFFEYCFFKECSFASADVSGSKFIACSFYDKTTTIDCNFTLSDIHNSSFTDCDMSFRASVDQIFFNAPFFPARQEDAIFQLGIFANVVSKKLIFSNSELVDCDFRYCDFDGVFIEKYNLVFSLIN